METWIGNSCVHIAVDGNVPLLHIWYRRAAESYGTIHESLTQIVLGKMTFPELVLWTCLFLFQLLCSFRSISKCFLLISCKLNLVHDGDYKLNKL